MTLDELFMNRLVQARKGEILKVSTIYPTRVTAEVVYPVPGRTTVRTYTLDEVSAWRAPSNVMVSKYEHAWGFR